MSIEVGVAAGGAEVTCVTDVVCPGPPSDPEEDSTEAAAALEPAKEKSELDMAPERNGEASP